MQIFDIGVGVRGLLISARLRDEECARVWKNITGLLYVRMAYAMREIVHLI